MNYSPALVRLCKQYAKLIRDIERSADRNRIEELDFERQDLHNEIQDLMYRLHIATDRDSVHTLALGIARNA